ncbi:MAG: ATP-binding protein [Bacteroidales bacterium]|nr:ATP-binding protein [Bacteroidales bacterium]
MIRPRNPFVIGRYVGPEYFCDRVEETRTLKHHITNGRNVVIMSERRLGKTGLIEHCLNQADIQSEYYCFFFDIFAAHSMREFVCELANEVFRKLAPTKKSILLTVSSFLRSLQTTFSIDPNSGVPQMNLSLGDIEQPETTLDELLAMLEAADRPCIIAVDEFQQIAQFEENNVEAILRTKIQHLKNVQFIFAGSKKHLLEEIFDNPSRPFYNSVVFMQLQPIDQEVYVQFCQQLFGAYHKVIDEALIRHAYRYFGGVTWYLQLFMNEAFGTTDRESSITDSSFDEVLQHLIDTKRFSFEESYARLTEKQKAVIRAMAAEYPKSVLPTSKDFILTYKLKTASIVQTALKGLEDKGIIQHNGETRQITDLLFAIWLKQRMG